MQSIDVQGKLNNGVVTFWVMSQLLKFLGLSRDCADFRDPTAALRFMPVNLAITAGSARRKSLVRAESGGRGLCPGSDNVGTGKGASPACAADQGPVPMDADT